MEEHILNLHPPWCDTHVQWGSDVQRTLGNEDVPTASPRGLRCLLRAPFFLTEAMTKMTMATWILLSRNVVEGAMSTMTLILIVLRILVGQAKAT